MNTNLLVWLVLPYLSIILLIGGMIWRYRTDQFGWTSRSSQWNEPSILRWSSPLFHFGILFVFLGHVLGLVIPQSWTYSIGITEDTYHVMATVLGEQPGWRPSSGSSGCCTVDSLQSRCASRQPPWTSSPMCCSLWQSRWDAGPPYTNR